MTTSSAIQQNVRVTSHKPAPTCVIRSRMALSMHVAWMGAAWVNKWGRDSQCGEDPGTAAAEASSPAASATLHHMPQLPLCFYKPGHTATAKPSPPFRPLTRMQRVLLHKNNEWLWIRLQRESFSSAHRPCLREGLQEKLWIRGRGGFAYESTIHLFSPQHSPTRLPQHTHKPAHRVAKEMITSFPTAAICVERVAVRRAERRMILKIKTWTERDGKTEGGKAGQDEAKPLHLACCTKGFSNGRKLN